MKFDVKTQGKKMEVALEGRMDSATAPGFEKEIFQKLDLLLQEENECSKGKYGCKACQ